MHRTNPAALQVVLAELERAVHAHTKWREHALHVFAGRLSVNPHDLEADSHLRCGFGAWHFRQAPAALRELPSFAMLGAEHEAQHAVAGRLMAALAAGEQLAPADREEFEESSARVNFGLHYIRRELECLIRSRDTLTDAYSSGEMLRELREWRAAARNPGRDCCVVILEPDGLDEMNACHGYQLGAQAIRDTVQIVARNLRDSDKVYRHDGNRFLILLAQTNLASGKMVIERLREVLKRRLSLVDTHGSSVEMSVSFGVALLDPQVDALESIDRADQALTLAKTAGKGKIICWDPSVTTGVRLRRLEEKKTEET